ncbi:Protein kinase, AMP-activated, beta [Geosmithia morbida]|uniref:Protein kinase, AMP-activated, beta n=1 Tax=Geosmithia morbida TaxID=1094350 RepID=A0A9P4YQ18_9HYPO|nr:Protein kinase, AMP-activated, beta [Geosmithia morbida]KAF4121026.1 Protein kinase, AMP-activated, beta [Geosmithia morbida]
MGSFTFKWEHSAEEVYVTGTFDNWTKSVKLDNVGGIFQKTVELDETQEKIYYKFVVDNNWTTNESAPIEPDHDGNLNNFLIPQQIASATHDTPVFISSAGPNSSAAKMAGEQPIESQDDISTPAEIPGGFPETPAEETVSVNPLPASAGAINPISLEPGEKIPDSFSAQDINKNVKLDKESYERSDALPVADSETPVIPRDVLPDVGTPLDESIVKSVGPGATSATLAGQVANEPKQSDAAVASNFINSVGPESTTASLASQVPEEPEKSVSGDHSAAKLAAISTVGAGATTASLAGQVPKESKGDDVPGVVKDSQTNTVQDSQDQVDAATPEAGNIPGTVDEKAQVEGEIEDEVPEATVSSEETAAQNTGDTAEKAGDSAETTDGSPAPIVGLAAATGAVAGSAGIATAALTGEGSKDSEETDESKVGEVPETVKESQDKAIVSSPEASAVPEKVEEKVQVPEAAVTPEGVSGQKPGGGISDSLLAAGGAAAAGVAGAATLAIAGKDAAIEKGAPLVNQAGAAAASAADNNLSDSMKQKLPDNIPDEVTRSISEAKKSPEAAASASAVEDKKAVESELLSEVERTPAEGESKVAQLETSADETVNPGSQQSDNKVDESKSSTSELGAGTAAAGDAATVGAGAAGIDSAYAGRSGTTESATESTNPTAGTTSATKSTSALGTTSTATEPAESAGTTSTTKPTEPVGTTIESATNGSSSKPAETTNGTTSNGDSSKPAKTTAGEGKKRGRFSTILSKIKHKILD